jgi:hypothetical protein
MKNFAILCIALALAGCGAITSGPQGGSVSTVDGIEVWRGGGPARPYQVIDTIRRVGPDNSATYATEERAVIRSASQRGADAAIILDEVMVVSRASPIDSRPIMAPKVDAELIKYQ